MKACITTKRLCKVEEIQSDESIIREFDCSDEQYEALMNEENSWNYCQNIIYLNQEEFINLG